MIFSCGDPHMDIHMGISIWRSIWGSPWGFPQKSCGNGMGVGVEIPFPRQPWIVHTYNLRITGEERFIEFWNCKIYVESGQCFIIVREYSLLNDSLSWADTIMWYNKGKFQELNFIILRLQMNILCNNSNMRETLHFWVEIYIESPHRSYFVWTKWFLKCLAPHSPLPHL